MRVLVLGGGIAGSTLAYALHRFDIEAEVVEARAENDAGGAFLTLAPNGVNALGAIGLGDVPFAADGFEISGVDFHNARGRQIAQLRGERDLDDYGARGVLLRRSLLASEVADRAKSGGVAFRYGARVERVVERSGQQHVVFDDGTGCDADVIIGADGVWSVVRQSVWPDAPAPAYTGIVDCGGITQVDLPDSPRQQMYFGHRAFFGFVVRDGVAYWFTNVPRSETPARGELEGIGAITWMATIRALHADDPPPVRRILDAAASSLGAWAVHDLADLTEWHQGAVCLIGDAVHAVSPSSGQGASLAIEDAVVLAGCLRDASHPSVAFERFEAVRKERAQRIVRFGRRISDRKAPTRAGDLFQDLSLGFFLRLGARATAEQYGYRVPDELIAVGERRG